MILFLAHFLESFVLKSNAKSQWALVAQEWWKWNVIRLLNSMKQIEFVRNWSIHGTFETHLLKYAKRTCGRPITWNCMGNRIILKQLITSQWLAYIFHFETVYCCGWKQESKNIHHWCVENERFYWKFVRKKFVYIVHITRKGSG